MADINSPIHVLGNLVVLGLLNYQFTKLKNQERKMETFLEVQGRTVDIQL
jgi:hypothetical protein